MSQKRYRPEEIETRRVSKSGVQARAKGWGPLRGTFIAIHAAVR